MRNKGLVSTEGVGNRRFATGVRTAEQFHSPSSQATATLLSPTLSCSAKCLPLAEINSWQGNLENWAAQSTVGRVWGKRQQRNNQQRWNQQNLVIEWMWEMEEKKSRTTCRFLGLSSWVDNGRENTKQL